MKFLWIVISMITCSNLYSMKKLFKNKNLPKSSNYMLYSRLNPYISKSLFTKSYSSQKWQSDDAPPIKIKGEKKIPTEPIKTPLGPSSSSTKNQSSKEDITNNMESKKFGFAEAKFKSSEMLSEKDDPYFGKSLYDVLLMADNLKEKHRELVRLYHEGSTKFPEGYSLNQWKKLNSAYEQINNKGKESLQRERDTKKNEKVLPWDELFKNPIIKTSFGDIIISPSYFKAKEAEDLPKQQNLAKKKNGLARGGYCYRWQDMNMFAREVAQQIKIDIINGKLSRENLAAFIRNDLNTYEKVLKECTYNKEKNSFIWQNQEDSKSVIARIYSQSLLEFFFIDDGLPFSSDNFNKSFLYKVHSFLNGFKNSRSLVDNRFIEASQQAYNQFIDTVLWMVDEEFLNVKDTSDEMLLNDYQKKEWDTWTFFTWYLLWGPRDVSTEEYYQLFKSEVYLQDEEDFRAYRFRLDYGRLLDNTPDEKVVYLNKSYFLYYNYTFEKTHHKPINLRSFFYNLIKMRDTKVPRFPLAVRKNVILLVREKVKEALENGVISKESLATMIQDDLNKYTTLLKRYRYIHQTKQFSSMENNSAVFSILAPIYMNQLILCLMGEENNFLNLKVYFDYLRKHPKEFENFVRDVDPTNPEPVNKAWWWPF